MSYACVGTREPSSSEDAHDAMALLAQLWELSTVPSSRVPMPNPVSMMRKDLRKLCTSSASYHVSAKLDGTRYLLLCGFHERTLQPYNFLIDRAGALFRVDVRGTDDEVDARVRHGTLLDGELVRGVFVVFDAVAVCGVDCKRLPYSERLQQARELLPTLRMTEATLRLKPVFALRRIRDIPRDMPDDGYIFMPEADPVRTGMHCGMFKWKEHHTLDFTLRVDDEGPSLSYSDTTGLVPIARLQLTLAPSAALTEACAAAPCVVECSVASGQVTVLSQRPDKSTPNFERTVRLTLQNMREQLSRDELVQWCTR